MSPLHWRQTFEWSRIFLPLSRSLLLEMEPCPWRNPSPLRSCGCLHILYVDALYHGAVQRMKMWSQWPWPLVIRSNPYNKFFIKQMCPCQNLFIFKSSVLIFYMFIIYYHGGASVRITSLWPFNAEGKFYLCMNKTLSYFKYLVLFTW